MALGFGASLSTTVYIRELRARLDRLESTPRVEPREVKSLHKELVSVQDTVSKSLAELADLRTTGKHEVELDQRIGTIETALQHAASVLTVQSRKIESFDELKDDIAPNAIDQRIEAFNRGTEEHWQRLADEIQTAIKLAQTTKAELDHQKQDLDHQKQDMDSIERHLTRDEDRMWRELVGPTVQLMGEDTVGSGVLLQSEPIDGTKEYRTYLLTAWHVVRDIQNGADNLHNPVPVTIYGQDKKLWSETAELLKYDATIDGALLKLNTTRKIDCGARLAPRSKLAQVKIFEQVYAVGCPLGNDPIPTFGEIADTHHVVDGGHYWMISAPTYIGNSGGGIFDADTHELLGIFSKIYTHGSLRPTVVPHMGLVTSLKTIYDWLDGVGFASLEPPEPTVQTQTASAKR
jgi:hypothetical protein